MIRKIKEYVATRCWPELVARVIMGLVFLFSAGVKAVDPYGMVLKMEEYFVAMGLEGLWVLSGALTVAVVALEMALGVALLLSAMPRATAWVALVFNGFYLMLTLWTAIANPVAECGCFGDVLVLTNWQTFGKNVVLGLLALVIFARRRVGESRRWSSVASLVALVATAAFAIYSLICLPVVEKFPFGEGVNIPQAIEEDLLLSAEESQVVCRSVATGEVRCFSVDDQEWWNEDVWEFVELDTPKEEVKVRASEFVLYSGGFNLTPQLMMANMCRLLCVERVERLSLADITKLRAIADDCLSRGDRVVVVTSSPLIDAQTVLPNLECCNLDAVVLRALLRAPAGMVSLSDGTIIHKASLEAIKIGN